MAGNAEEDGWERSDFPIVCETCLGDNPYVRMTRSEYDKECKVCTRPFTVFRWRAGTKGRYKKTEICQTCAKLKNVCQTCLLDLQFNLPVQVRDSAMAEGVVQQEIPQSDVNREYLSRIADKTVSQGLLPYSKAQYNPVLQKLARNQPYYERNRAHVCSFFLRNACNRGDSCPFRHEKPEDQGDLAHQNIKDRYYGVNDPVAKKLLKRVSDRAPVGPNDKDVKTLFVGNVDNRIKEEDLKDHFYYFGEINSIKIVTAQKCAFIEFASVTSAQSAMSKLHNSLIINGVYLKLAWAKPQQVQQGKNDKLSASGAEAYADTSFYPSMDPERLGAIPDEDRKTKGQPPTSSAPITSNTTTTTTKPPPINWAPPPGL